MTDLPKVLELAKRPNAVIKVSGACTLSREPYPFPEFLGVNRDCPALQRFRLGAGKIRRAGDCHTEEALRSAIGTSPASGEVRLLVANGGQSGQRLRSPIRWQMTHDGHEKAKVGIAG
jgi:hypothetical protein